MRPLYVAQLDLQNRQFAALRPQHFNKLSYPYLFPNESPIVAGEHTQFTSCSKVGQAGRNDPVANEKNYRRSRCQRASKYCSRSALWVWSQLVQTQRQLKNTSWLIPRRFLTSQSILANTSKIVLFWDRAIWPAPDRNLKQTEGAVC